MTVLATRRSYPRRVALLSLHTSPLDQPGTGDAGGLNVYVVEVSKRLAAVGVEVDIFTRATSSRTPARVELAPGVVVQNLPAGPFEGLRKEDLPGELCTFTNGVLLAEAAREAGWYDVVHSHYWLSGQVGRLIAARWQVPLVHTMHTMAKVKNLDLAADDTAEPEIRIEGEQDVVRAATRLIANTGEESRQLVNLYGASPRRTAVVHPGVDLDHFRPGDRAAARERLGLRADAIVLLFVGRIQPLKAPDVLVRAAAALPPHLRERVTVVVCGGESGNGVGHAAGLRELAENLGLGQAVRFEPPATRDELVHWYRAADLTVVPSHSESFGLVAVESQACATPVVAAAVGGLPTAVADGVSGLLVPGHQPADWAATIERALSDHGALSNGARKHASSFSWSATAAGTLDVYSAATIEYAQSERLLAAGS